jgi:predicted MPP superfamily phosphohydrolase
MVDLAIETRPDIILLGGDYVHRGERYFDPCFAELSRLRAPFGVFGVLQGPVCRVFVSRGVGTVTPPLRMACPPEINLITLV